MKNVISLIGKAPAHIKKERKLPSLLQIKIAKRRLNKKEIMPLPLKLQIEPTTKCNYKCVTCSRTSLPLSRQNKDMPLRDFISITEQVPNLKSVHLQGLGEPFLTADFLEILEYARKKKIQMSTTTNASLLTSHEDIKKFFPMLNEIRISLNSINPQTHHKITGVENYEQIKRNIELIASLKDSYPTTKIWLTFVVTHLNYNELDAFFELCRNLKINCGIVEVESWYVPSQEKYDNEMDFIKKSREFSQLVREKVQREIQKSGNIVRMLSSDRRKLICRWPFDSCFITVDGYVTPCCIRQDPEVFNFGNVFKTPFKEIYNSDCMKNFRKSMINNTTNRICDQCPN